MGSSILDEYRPITTPAIDVATIMRTMPYGEYMDLMHEFSGGDETLQQVLAKRLWLWATKSD